LTLFHSKGPKYFQKEEDLSQEEVVAEMLNAPLGFLPFDLEAHYNSQSTTPESEKNGPEHLPGCTILNYFTKLPLLVL
jgi:hypothetical protein